MQPMNNKTFEFTIEGTSAVMQHKFNGQEEEKRIAELPHAEQAERHAYRTLEKNIGIPAVWIRGSLIDAFVDAAPSKSKQATKRRVSPRIRVEPIMLDTGLTEYEIDVQGIPSPKTGRGGTRTIVVRPLLNKWQVSGKLITGLDESREMEKWLAQAGEEIGIGANRINGYGRWKVTTFKEM